MGLKEQPRRLGKGLAALMGDTTMDAGIGPTEGARHLAIASLHPGPFQPRRAMDEDALEELAASLKSRGVLQPLLVRSFPGQAGQYQIIAGERRWRAAQRAGLHELQRQDLDPIEEAEGYQRLLDEFGMIQEDLATAVAKSRPHITNMLRLLNLPSDVQASLRSGDLSSGHARALMQHPDPQAGARTIIANRLTVRQAEAMVAAALTPKPAPPAPLAPDVNSVTRMLERELIEILGLRVRIRFNGKSGSVNLAYENLGQLDGILALLRGHQ
ncbi:ParB/RepB/Spo0J family partition protein [Acidiphilium sp. 34-64-41]|uniref:ParB/RepB/Spo0J family partition protein n=1 Tax=Acidiphilium sp. 34-64-41 TaxID=1970297 RepID=UPI000BCC3028|nr:ParB/RepB/Spo0J family partition protein [Acidiphilium sp. 34-64-41]OZB29204.1 MAG: chromosome partitioning protein ParB [Acidiphilium sp. 34-64-41]